MKWKRRGMVFMMNDFKAYLRYYVNSNKRLLILVFIILFLIMPFFTFNYMGLPRGPYSLDTFYTGFIALGAATCAGGCILSYLLPIYNFRYLYKKRSHEMYFSSRLLYNAGARISGETALYADTVILLSRFIHPAFDSVFHFHLFKREMQQSD